MQANTAQILEFKSNDEMELQLLMNEIESFAPGIIGKQGFDIYDGISEVKRAGWIRKEIGIPEIYAESVLEHSMNVKNAADATIIGTPEIIVNHKGFPIMGKVHDMPEGYDVLPDITPHDNYTQEQKDILEQYAVLFIESVMKQEGKQETNLLREYIKQQTQDSKIMHILDKLDAGIKALDYEKLGFKKQVSIFHPYTQEKIAHDPHFTKIYEIMLEREFSHIPAHFQYFMLLELAGDYDTWRAKIKETLILNK